MYKKFVAVDQYGDTLFLKSHPRKELTEHHAVKHADKIYRDPDARHVGYIVAGHWYEVLRISPLNEVSK
jgi:hypothetical protein